MAIRHPFKIFAVAALLGTGALAGAGGPGVLATVQGGLWAVGKNADGRDARNVCLADVAELAQWEHRGRACRHETLSSSGNEVVISYNCGGSDFGHSRMTLLTPRTLRVLTQGISDNYPFQYTLHARRVGNCPSR